MRHVILLRHAKSDWDAEFETDHDRPLARRGRKAAGSMGRFLASCGSAPELIISSTAVRAMETARLAVDGGGLGVPIVKNADLYGCSSATVLSAVRSADSGASCIMLVGHEPTWSSTVSRLIGGGNVRMPTAAAARIDFEIDRWSDADFGRGELAWLVVPRAIS